MSFSDSDTHSSDSSDDDIPCSPVQLKRMSSSDSSDNDEQQTQRKPSLLFLKVKKETSNRNSTSQFTSLNIEDDLSAHFGELIRSDGTVTFFPKTMEAYLSKNYPKTLCSLKAMEYDAFFMCVGKSLIVTLNVDNTRVRISQSLICDVCVFSSSQSVLVLSFVKPNYKPERLDMYNTFVARGVTEALRCFAGENVSVVKGVIEEGTDVMTMLPHFQSRSRLFHVASSLKTSKEKATTEAKALLRSIALSKAYPILYHDIADTDTIWFLTRSEFDFLSNSIDMVNSTFEQTLTGDKNLVALEMAIRRSKQDSTALLVTSLKEKLKPGQMKNCRNIAVFEKAEQLTCSSYTLIITDTFKDIRPNVYDRNNTFVVVISSTKSDEKAVRKYYKKKNEESNEGLQTTRLLRLPNFFKKRINSRSIDITTLPGEPRGSVSAPNLTIYQDCAAEEEDTEHNLPKQLFQVSPEKHYRVSTASLGHLVKVDLRTTPSGDMPEVEGDILPDLGKTKEQILMSKVQSRNVQIRRTVEPLAPDAFPGSSLSIGVKSADHETPNDDRSDIDSLRSELTPYSTPRDSSEGKAFGKSVSRNTSVSSGYISFRDDTISTPRECLQSNDKEQSCRHEFQDTCL